MHRGQLANSEEMMARYPVVALSGFLGLLMVLAEVQAESRRVLKGRIIRPLAVESRRA